MSDVSDSTDSPSLPSLSLPSISLTNAYYPVQHTQHMNGVDRDNDRSDRTVQSIANSQLLTIREYDTKLNELRRENFNLKLRIYFLDKEKSGNAHIAECESAIAKELLKREKTIKAYQKLVEDKEAILREVKLNYESKLSDKSLQIESLANDKQTLSNELTEISSVCRLLMAHLNEFVEFWKRCLPDYDNSPNDMMASLLNSSEDLLNSASVLITNDGNDSFKNNLSAFGRNLRNNVLTGNNTPYSGIPLNNVGFPNFNYNYFRRASNIKLPQAFDDQFCAFTSESDDVWSEPDRDESRARIGLEDSVTTFVPISRNNKYKHKHKRSTSVATGMSSLGLLPDISVLTDKTNEKQKTPTKESVSVPVISLACKSIQTDMDANDDMLSRLEKMKLSKERLEKAITKQLHKTDKLLEKAKISLKENEQI